MAKEVRLRLRLVHQLHLSMKIQITFEHPASSSALTVQQRGDMHALAVHRRPRMLDMRRTVNEPFVTVMRAELPRLQAAPGGQSPRLRTR